MAEGQANATNATDAKQESQVDLDTVPASKGNDETNYASQNQYSEHGIITDLSILNQRLKVRSGWILTVDG